MSGSQITYRATSRVVRCYVSDATFNSNGNNGSIIILKGQAADYYCQWALGPSDQQQREQQQEQRMTRPKEAPWSIVNTRDPVGTNGLVRPPPWLHFMCDNSKQQSIYECTVQKNYEKSVVFAGTTLPFMVGGISTTTGWDADLADKSEYIYPNYIRMTRCDTVHIFTGTKWFRYESVRPLDILAVYSVLIYVTMPLVDAWHWASVQYNVIYVQSKKTQCKRKR